MRGSSTLSITLSEGMRWNDWNTKPRLALRNAASWLSFILPVVVPFMSTVPDVGVSRRPMMLSRVDLPQPEGPMIDTNSPFCISRLTFSSARVSISFVRYTLLISLSVMMLMIQYCFMVFIFLCMLLLCV